MWEYYYKVRLYEFTNLSSRYIYESWWIEQLKPYGNKAGRYSKGIPIMPSSHLGGNNWSQIQKEAFLEKVSPEDIVLWENWKSTTSQYMDVITWKVTQKMRFISNLATKANVSIFNLYRKIRKKARI